MKRAVLAITLGLFCVSAASGESCGTKTSCAACAKDSGCVWCAGEDEHASFESADSSSEADLSFCTKGNALGPKDGETKALCGKYQWRQCKCSLYRVHTAARMCGMETAANGL